MVDETVKIDSETAKVLTNIIIEIENLQNQIDISRGQIDEAFSFAKGKGFEPKIIKKVLKLRKLDEKKKEEEELNNEIAKFFDEKVSETQHKEIINGNLST